MMVGQSTFCSALRSCSWLAPFIVYWPLGFRHLFRLLLIAPGGALSHAVGVVGKDEVEYCKLASTLFRSKSSSKALWELEVPCE